MMQQSCLIRFAKVFYFCSLAFSIASFCFAATRDEVFIVTMEGTPGVHRFPDMMKSNNNKARPITQSLEAEAYFAELQAQHDEFLSSFFEMGTPYTKLYSYSHVLNGFAVQLSPEKAEMLRKSPRILRVESDWQVETFTTHTPDFLGLPNRVWPVEGGPTGAGENIVIGIIDTGIDPSHPSFSTAGRSVAYPPINAFRGKCEQTTGFLCNGKIIAAQHFSKAAQAAGAFNSSNDFASPLDGDGHGTHTASIAAGSHGVQVNFNGFYFGDASGMAPRARISVYKALYRQFGGFVSDVVAAIDQAAKDGVNVLSLSVGPSSPPSTVRLTFLNAFDVALLSAVKSGVFVVQAAGNGGPYSRTMASFSPWIMSVAAGLDDRSYSNQVYLGNGAKLTGIGIAPATPGEQLYNLVLAEDAFVMMGSSRFSSNPTNCQQPGVFNRTLVQGKILMCTYSFSFVYGAATVKRVVDTAQNLSAVGFILFAKTDLPGNKFNPTPFAIPGIVITDVQDAMDLLNYYNTTKSSAQAKLGNGMTPTLKGTAPQVALFSSRGPGVKNYMLQDADVLKPNILAPGSLIWGAWTPIGTDEPDYQGQQFALISGTSMAAPHVAGVAALILQAHPHWSPAAVASAMMTTAFVEDANGSPILAQRYSGNGSVIIDSATPFDFGNGALNANAALDPGLVFEAGYGDYINFLCAMLEVDQTLVLNTTGSNCDAMPRRPDDLNIPSITIANMLSTRTITRTVTSVSDKTETYVVSVVPPSGISMEITPNAFTIPMGGSVTLTIVLRVNSSPSGEYNFGRILLQGDKTHLVRMPVAVRIGSS